ncbi:FAD-binding domain-containing protein 27 [Elsinoe fawcettii]|nr:FAD-binding domain-containing protein 27 [Elsinoe fawcettii]
MPLQVVIVGAGIAGLTAAIALAPHGHQIIVLEKSAFAAEVGAAFHFGPYGVRCLKRLGIDIAAMRPNTCMRWNQTEACTLRDLGLKFDLRERQMELGVVEDEIMVHRVDAHRVLREKATSYSNVNLRLGESVKNVDPEPGIVTLLSGEQVIGDVVIGADGIHSRCVAAIDPAATERKAGGINMYRWMVETKKAMQIPVVRDFLEKTKFSDHHTTFIHGGTKHSMIMYACRDGELINCSTFQMAGSEMKQLPEGDFTSPGSTGEVLHLMQGWPESYRALAGLATDVKHWAVISRDVPKTFNKGRLVLIGDAAHPTQPLHAAGANMGIEDAGVLSVLLGAEVTPDSVAERLQLFHDLRYERTVVTKFSSEFQRIGWLPTPEAAEKQMGAKVPGAKLPSNMEAFLWPVDVMADAEKALATLRE